MITLRIFPLILLLIYEIDTQKLKVKNETTKLNETKISRRHLLGSSVIPVLSDGFESYGDICERSHRMVVYYNFESTYISHKRVTDRSGCDNHGIMDPGTIVLQEPRNTCNNIAYLWNHDIKIPASSFQNPPKNGISVSIWVKFAGNRRSRGLFSVRGPHFGSLSLTVTDPLINWLYQDSTGAPIFSCSAETIIKQEDNIKQGGWIHIAATYNTDTSIAQIYINGMPNNRSVSSVSKPFRYWGNDVRVGSSDTDKPIEGFIDEFKLFNYDLNSQEVYDLAGTCQFSLPGGFIAKRNDISGKFKSNYLVNKEDDGEEKESENSEFENENSKALNGVKVNNDEKIIAQKSSIREADDTATNSDKDFSGVGSKDIN